MKKKNDAALRTPLFDRIFRPKMMVLANGHSVARPRSRAPLILGLVVAALMCRMLSFMGNTMAATALSAARSKLMMMKFSFSSRAFRIAAREL